MRFPLRRHPITGPESVHSSLDESLVDARVGIDTPVAQEGPAAADLLDARRVDPAHHDLLPIRARGGDHHAERIGEKGPAPELDARTPSASGFSSPARLTAATYTPLAMAWPR